MIARQLPKEELDRWPKTPTGALCTAAATLSRCKLPFAKELTRCRGLQHLLSHYAQYEAAASTGGGRLFPCYQLCGAVTGRMSCCSPNLQSSPRTPEFRALVRAGEQGGALVKGDFSQVELRVLAEVSGDERMRKAFAEGEDLHRVTAAAVLGVESSNITKQDRQLAKAVNFGLIYGQSLAGFQRYAESNFGVALSPREAARARSGFFAAFPGVAAWQKAQRALAARGCPVITPSGRVAAHLLAAWREACHTARGSCALGKAGPSAECQLQRIQREALNFPIQGGAAEVMLACLDLLRPRLQPLGRSCKLICVVHDEFVLECSDAAVASEAAAGLRRAMEESWGRVFPKAAPLGEVGVSITVGANWAELGV